MMDLRPSLLSLARMLALAILAPLSLLAQPVRIGSGSSLMMPQGWKILQVRHDGPAAPATSCLESGASRLLLTARPDDAHRDVVLTIYRTAFLSALPAPLDGEQGIKAETEKLLCSMLNLGYTPDDVKTSTIKSSQGTRIVTIEVTGKNTAGNERIFSEAAAGEAPSPVIRIYTSREKNDDATAQDLKAILDSLTVGERWRGNTPPVAASGTVNTAAPNSTAAASAPANSPAPTSAATSLIVSEYSDALVIVEGKESVGSGFICSMGGRDYAISNAHVICSAPGFKLTNLKSAAFTPGASGIAVGHDIVRMEVKNPPKSFQIMEGLDANVKIGDGVAVLGNIQGAMVVKPVEGKIQGIGPNLIEVDAPFEPGNSGSPIIHKPSGKVIGIATYLLKKKAKGDGDKVSTEIRRFGYRLDSVKTWEPVNWQILFNQAVIVGKIETVSNDFIRMAQAENNEKFAPGTYRSAGMQRTVQSFMDRVKGKKHLGPAEQKMILNQLLGDLRSLSKNDLPSFDMRTGYDYFRRDMEEQISFRDDIYKNISRQIEQRSSAWGL